MCAEHVRLFRGASPLHNLVEVHRFMRNADDCNIYVGSERAGHRVMESITPFSRRVLYMAALSARTTNPIIAGLAKL